MRSLSILTAVGLALVACEPAEKCSGDLYFDGRNCRPCPDDASFENGSCVCDDDARYRFRNHRCELRPGVEPEPEVDAGAPSCDDYCGFATSCIGGNAIVMAALSDIVDGLHANDPAECRSACEDDSSADGGDEVLACFRAGRDAADCADDDTQAGITRAFTLVRECCAGKSGGLCASICETLLANELVSPMIEFCD